MTATEELKELQQEIAKRKVYVSAYQLSVYRKRVKKLKHKADLEQSKQHKPIQPCLF
jgi:hypothetical protein